jgi:hypothetical protein
MNRILPLLLIWIPNICFGVPQKIEITPLSKRAGLIADAGAKADFDSIPQADLNQTLEILRGIAEGAIRVGNMSPDRSGARIALLSYGDEQTLADVIKIYRDYNSRAAWQYIPEELEWSKQPRAIFYLAEDFNGNEDLHAFYGSKGSETEFGITVQPKSIYSGVIALRIIMKSPAFSDELKAWAKQTYGLDLKDGEGFRNLMQKWWEQNKEAFARKDYKAVKPGILTVEPTPDAVPPSQPEPAEIATPKPIPSPVPAPVVSILSEEKSSSWFLTVAGLVIVIAGAGLFWLLKKPSSP